MEYYLIICQETANVRSIFLVIRKERFLKQTNIAKIPVSEAEIYVESAKDHFDVGLM